MPEKNLMALLDLGFLPKDAKTLRLDAPISDGKAEFNAFIGPYRLLQQIGAGGFGIVWRAEQIKPIHREVALKVIKPGMDSQEIIARFEAERQALALMDHPNIAAVLDAGATPNGRPYFVMELVRGVPITTYCDERRLSIRQRLELFIPVCQAVQHAHQKAILHRDLKPSNILIEEVDGKPVPKVIDFGIAKALGTSPETALKSSLARTRDGLVIGTPQYMSPEQAGSVPDVDTRSDIYTLGIILYELLTGQTPLSTGQLEKAALDEVFKMVREGEIKRPSSRLVPVNEAIKLRATERHTLPQKLEHELRGDLDWILLRALEKERDRRYQTANALAADIQCHLKDEPVSAGPPSASYRLHKFVKRHRVPVVAGALIALALVGGVIGTGIGVRKARQERDAKQIQYARAQVEKARADKNAVDANAYAAKVSEEKARQDELLWCASQNDHEAALRAFDKDNPTEGLAYLKRSLTYRSDNKVALAASAAHAFGINSPTWRTRVTAALHGPVTCTTFSPDGRKVAIGSADTFASGEVRLIDSATGKKLQSLKLAGAIIAVRFSPTGQWLAVAGGKAPSSKLDEDVEGAVWVFEAATGREVSKVELGGNSDIFDIEFSRDGRWLAVGSRDKTARVIEVATGKEISRAQFDFAVGPVNFSPDGRLLAVGSYDKTVHRVELASGARWVEESAGKKAWIVEAATGKRISRIDFGDMIKCLSFSPNGRLVAIGSDDKTVRIIETPSGKESRKIEFGGPVTCLSFGPDGRWVVAGSEDGTVRVFEAATGKEISKMENKGVVQAVGFSPDARWVIAGSADGTARVIEAATGKEISKTDFEKAVSSVEFSPDGRWLVVGGADGIARVLETATGKAINKADFECGVVSSAFSPDSRWFAAGTGNDPIGDKELRIIESVTGANVSKLTFSDSDNVTALSFAPDGQRLAAGTGLYGGKVIVVEAATAREICKAEFGGVTAVEFSHDGALIAAGGLDYTARVLDAKSARPVHTYEFNAAVTSVGFSPDNHLLSVGTADGVARAIRTFSGDTSGKPEFGEKFVNKVAFSLEGCYLAAGTDSGAVRVTEAATGKLLAEFWIDGGGPVTTLTFSPNSHRLAVGCGAGTAFFEAKSDKLIWSLANAGATLSLNISSDGRWLGIGSSNGTVVVVEAATGREISRANFRGPVTSVQFSPNGRWLMAGSLDHTMQVFDCSWFNPTDSVVVPAWLAALKLHSIDPFPTGAPKNSSRDEMEVDRANELVRTFVLAKPKDDERWQHSILRWSEMLPEARTTSPWTDEPVWRAVGRWLMQANIGIDTHSLRKAFWKTPTITDCADQAPWHPLVPIGLAQLEPRPDSAGDKGTREAIVIRQQFLAELTLRRLRDADVKVYGPDALASYAAKAADWMEELGLHREGATARAMKWSR